MRVKLDNRIRTLIENGVAARHRSLIIIIGDKARDQVVTLHHILAKARTMQHTSSVLWCYKKELDISSNRKKRINEIKKKREAGLLQTKEENLFEQFILSTHIRYCYYAESHRILGNTFGMAVLQDFEALTPNLLARTMETVEGGGLIILLIQSVNSLKQLYTLSMDIHKRYRTEAHSHIVPRFNERFILSLANCKTCLAMDDQLNVFPISSTIFNITSILASQKNAKNESQSELQKMQRSLVDTKPIGPILNKCVTLCQAKVLLRLLDVATEKSLNTTCSLTAARGRGKSAALGLAIAGAIGFGFTNIFVTSPNVENLRTLFEFVLKGFDAIGYMEHADFDVVKSMDPALDKCVTRINVFRRHRQNIQYIEPTEAIKLVQAELLIVDEAAAIPIPLVKKLISGPYLVFLASTISGYEGTGRSLSLKLLDQLRQQSSSNSTAQPREKIAAISQRRQLFELTLEESIRYAGGDPVEEWLNNVLCLNPLPLKDTISGAPAPEKCELYYVNRDSLFSYHKAAEIFLTNLMSIYVAAHYKNSPDDLQLLSDAPAHHIFVLMAPVTNDQTSIPQILAVIQLCLEGAISQQSVINVQERGKKVAGDLIPWTLSQYYLDSEFTLLCGARIVRIAVHPDFQGMGYGSMAIKMLIQYYKGKFCCLTLEKPKNKKKNNKEAKTMADLATKCNEMMEIEEGYEQSQLLNEEISPRPNLPPLLQRLTERPPEQLDYIGASFGLTLALLKFWKRLGFVPVYLRRNANQLTGEHSCIMLNTIVTKMEEEDDQNLNDQNAVNMVEETANSDGTWLGAFFNEFRRRLIPLLGISFTTFTPHLALSLLFMNQDIQMAKWILNKPINRNQLRHHLTDLDLRRLCHYAKNMADHNLITDLLPTLATLYFNDRIDAGAVTLDLGQAALLLGVGLQRKLVDKTAAELGLPANQAYALLNKAIRRLSDHFDALCRDTIIQESSNEQQKEQNDAVDNVTSPKKPALKKMRLFHFE